SGTPASFIDVYEDDFGGSSGDEYEISFQLFSHSNINWKDLKWRPEVHILTECADVPTKVYPNVEFHTYNVTERLDEQAIGFSDYDPGVKYEVNPILDTDPALIEAIFDGFSGNFEAEAFVVIKSGETLLAKQALRFSRDGT